MVQHEDDQPDYKKRQLADSSDIPIEMEPDAPSPDKSTSLPLSLRRPKRHRKPPTRRYEEMQQQELIEQVERRQTLRTQTCKLCRISR